MYLVETNIVSEARKGRKANAGVSRWYSTVDEAGLFLPVQTVGELRQGVERLRLRGDAPQASLLESWLNQIVLDYADRVLVFDEECAQVWGNLLAKNPHNAIDKQIAAIALIHDLTVVTRNIDDFAGTGVRLMNPFE